MTFSRSKPYAMDSVQSCVKWLDHAAAALNPERRPHHAISVHELHAFMCAAAPPLPRALQEQWSTQVWTMPGEPYEVYFLRCLAHQSGVTLLSPHFSSLSDAECTLTEGGEAEPTPAIAPALFCETCVVVGLRVEPTAKNLLQTGWDTQACPHCPGTILTPADMAHDRAIQKNQPQQAVLPLLYGGDTCASCGRALPLLPAWTRVAYLVLQRRDRTRAAAVAYGDGALRHLTLGATVHALLYSSQTEQQEPLLVVHAAWPSGAEAPRNTVLPAAEAAAAQRNYFRTFYDRMQSRVAATQRCSGTARSLDDMARGISPKLLGQTRAKKTVLLVVLYTLYGAQHFARDAACRRPLHLLLLGPAKTGKSALLRGVQLLMGAHADMLDSTVVRSGSGKGDGNGCADGASFLAALPARRRDLLMAGPGMTATTLVLDRLPASSAAAAAAAVASIQDVLERQRGCFTDADGTTSIDIPVHLIAAAEEESASAVQLAPFFALLTSLTPTNSLGESALISQGVVAASRARASSSRSGSRSSSSSNTTPSSQSSSSSLLCSSASCARASPSISQRGASLAHSSDANALAERLTEDDVHYLLSRTADPVLLDTVMSAAVCHASYIPRLAAAAALLEEAQPPACALLPLPSACRGAEDARLADVLDTRFEKASLSASPLCLEAHLRVLRCLSQARLMLETAEAVRTMGWTAEMCDEVWQLYEHHLVTLADLLHQRGGSSSSSSSSAQGAESARRVAISAVASPAPAHCEAGRPAPWPPSSTPGRNCRKTKKLSKKKLRLLFLEELHSVQSRPDRGCDVVLPAEAEQIFAQMGGSVTFGDPLDVVMGQLQEESFVLRRLGGWRAL